MGDYELDFGNWVDDTGVIFDANDFECIATFVSSIGTNNSSVPGDFGTTLNLGTSRAWQVEPTTPPPGGIVASTVTFDILVREVADTSNAITTRISITATLTDFEEGFE